MANIVIVSLVKGRNVIKPIICVIAKDILITYMGHRGEVGFLPAKCLYIK